MDFGPELVEQLNGALARDGFLVAVGDPGADEHAEDDDAQLDPDRELVLRAKIGGEALVDHVVSPIRSRARRETVSNSSRLFV